MTITTHLAISRAATKCGVVIPEHNGCVPPQAGTRIGITVGRFVHSCYVVGERDSNDLCPICLKP